MLSGYIKRPDRAERGFKAVNRGFIGLGRKELENLKAAYKSLGVNFNPAEPDVFFHKNDCNFQPRYEQKVMFFLKVNDQNGRLQAHDVKLKE